MVKEDSLIAIFVSEASNYSAEIQEFYQSCDRKVEFNPKDQVVLAFVDENLAGAVRLCFEEEVFVLRSMQVHSDFQRRGLGRLLLDRMDDLLKERKIELVYCMSYLHLEKFYAQIGFQRISPHSVPKFLQDRVEHFYLNRKSEKEVILMERIGDRT